MRKYAVIFMLVLFAGNMAFSAVPAERITSNCVIYIQLERVRDAIRQVAAYAAYAGQRMDGDALLTRVSRQLLGRGGFPGINMEKPLALYLYSFDDGPAFGAKGQRPEMVLSLQMSSKAEFQRFVQARLFLMGLRVRYLGGRAILSTSSRALAEYLRGKKIKALVLQGSQFSACVNMGKLQPMIKQMMQKSLSQKGRFGKLMGVFLDVYMGMIKDTLSAGYSLNLDRDGLEAGLGMAFRPGSDMALMANANRPDSLKVLSVIPRESIAVFADSSDPKSSEKMATKIVDRLSAFPTLQGFLRPMLRYLQKNSTGKSAVAMLPEPGIGISFAAVSGVKSVSRSRDFIAKMEDAVNKLPILEKMRQQGISVKAEYVKDVRTVAGKSVDTFRLKVTTPQPVPESKRAIFDTVMRLFTANIVYTGGYEIMVFGDSPDSWLGKMIRNVGRGTGGFKSSDAWPLFNRRYGRYPKNGMFYLSLKGFVQEIKEVAKSVMNVRVDILDMVSIPGSIYAYTYSAAGGMRFRFLLERETIAGIMRLTSLLLQDKKE